MSYLDMFIFLSQIFLNDTSFVFPETSRHFYFKVAYLMSNHVILHVSTRFYTFFVEDQQITTLKKEKKL